MKIEKQVLTSLPNCYSANSIVVDGETRILVASEGEGACLAWTGPGYDSAHTVWEGPGGTMSIVPIPGTNGEFLAVQKFFRMFQWEEAKVVHVRPLPSGGYAVTDILQLPYIHRFDLLTVGETWGATPEIAKLYSAPERNELSMVFQFEHIGLDQKSNGEKWDLQPMKVAELKRILAKWQTELGHDGWNSLFWNNHDLPRMLSRWGNDQEYRSESAKMLAILLHMMKGTPYIYQGEEIGMTNTPITDIAEARDIETLNMYNERLAKGYSEADILASINAKGRDNARRPMQWNASSHGGFTTGTPWIAVNKNYPAINAEAALADPDSIFYTYQKLIRLRKENPIIIWGEFELVDTVDEVISYYREYESERWLVVANFSDAAQPFSAEDEIAEVIIQNDGNEITSLKDIQLKPWQAFVVKVAA